MPQSIVRARSIAARLSALGLEPHLKCDREYVRVEVTPPSSPTPTVWLALLAALEQGDQFGLHTDGQATVAWTLVFNEGPPAPPVQRADPQP